MRFDRVLAAELWHATTTELNPQQKGRLLELTVAYLFETLANFSARLRPRGLDSEFDLILRSRDPDAFLHREIGTYVLVECKNEDQPMSARDVRDFAGKVRFAGCRSGVLATRLGITAGPGGSLREASYTVRKVYHRDGTILLLLTGDDLREVVDGHARLTDVLERRYEQVRFDLAGT